MPNMQGGIDGFLGVPGLTTSAFFPAWPLRVIAPILRRKHTLFNMPAAWGGMLLRWLLSLCYLSHSTLSDLRTSEHGVVLYGSQRRPATHAITPCASTYWYSDSLVIIPCPRDILTE